MKEEYKNLELVKNETDQRFEMNVDGNTAIIEYKEYPGKIALTAYRSTANPWKAKESQRPLLKRH